MVSELQNTQTSLDPSLFSHQPTMSNLNTIVQLTATNHFPIKLTATNFSVWRKQVESTLIGFDLLCFLDGSSQPPPKEITEKETTKSNPAYSLWFRQDQILISAILGSCSDAIQPLVSSAKTAKDAWERLNKSFASASRSRIISLKSRLAKNPKGTRTMTEFLNDMRAIADDLALVQSPVNEEDLLVHITSQLGEEYKPLVAALKVRVTPISYPELFEELLDFERSLQESAPIAEPILATVNATTRQGRIHRQGSRFDTDSSHGPRAGRFSSNNQQRPNRNSPNAASHQASGGYRSNRGGSYCQFCNIPGHTTQDCRKLSRFLRENNISSPVANVTTAAPTASTAPWLFDTGASNHVTPNTTNLHNLSEYGGPDEIVLGDGSSHGGASHAGGEH
ncbi:putative RNA-directed DNA polymerase [Helianthus annuus]|uniref:RNA-directed DNA polymerase n=1 Tax=Helianthus annuus TaxID=4232 RepID=A0A9K3NWZ4_HELAN|nr:putative RNA-directed DNA polymerase [Helianthus annuus]KAJ0608684.1 putative RNA-directed DNA polymerase [Helianthus annuus]